MKKRSLDHYVREITNVLREARPGLEFKAIRAPIPYENYRSPEGIFITFEWPPGDDSWLDLTETVSDLTTDALIDTGIPFFSIL